MTSPYRQSGERFPRVGSVMHMAETQGDGIQSPSHTDEGGEAPCYAHLFDDPEPAPSPPMHGSRSTTEETLTDAIERLRESGYEVDFVATDDSRLMCLACDAVYDPAVIGIDHTVRFEGDSNPDDEAILLALHDADGCMGLYSAAFGPSAPANDAKVLRLLARRVG
jgi:hypothetical protein